MARHLNTVANCGAQDRNKFPSYIYNHNDSFKSTNKPTAKNDLDGKSEMWDLTPTKGKYIPVDVSVVSSRRHFFDLIGFYKRAWGIPLHCKLVGGGESTLNSNSSGSVPGAANNNSPSSGAGGTTANNNNNNNNNSNWPAGHNPPSSGVGGNAWNAAGNNANSGGRQQVGSNNSNNASHPSSTSQNIGKFMFHGNRI